MNLITAVIKPHADGTLHLPLPEAWRSQSIRVKAELKPVGNTPESCGPAQNLKGFGCLRGRILMTPDFDEI
jgi:hypothetical protein